MTGLQAGINVNAPVQGILWMVAATFFGATMQVASRHLMAGLPAFEVVFLGMGVAALWMVAWFQRHGFRHLRTTRRKRYFLRAVLELAGWAASFYAIARLPLPAFTALCFLNPLLLSTAAIFVFRERATWHTGVAFGAGILGVLIILRPDFSGYLEGALYVAFACCLFCCCGILIKTLTRTETPPVITFYMLSLTTLLSLPLAVAEWRTPGSADWIYIALLGSAMAAQQFCVSNAIARAPLTTILPFSFCTLIFSAGFAWLFFSEVVTPETLLGGTVILGSAVYALYHTHKRTRREEKALAEKLLKP